jgi:hypothetical protein
MAFDMHVEGLGICPKQMIVNGGDVDTALQQFRHDRIDFRLEQHEVAHHHCRAMRGFECDPAAECE